MNTIYYENQFNQNEWFILTVLIITFGIIFFLPKRFPISIFILYLIVGTFAGLSVDHTISIKPFDYYDVNDSSKYEIFDFLTYMMYGSFTYIVIYFYDKLNITGYANIYYVVIWAVAAILMEWIGLQIGVFHYKNGYKIFYSVPIYLFVLSLYILYYHLINRKSQLERNL